MKKLSQPGRRDIRRAVYLPKHEGAVVESVSSFQVLRDNGRTIGDKVADRLSITCRFILSLQTLENPSVSSSANVNVSEWRISWGTLFSNSLTLIYVRLDNSPGRYVHVSQG